MRLKIHITLAALTAGLTCLAATSTIRLEDGWPLYTIRVKENSGPLALGVLRDGQPPRLMAGPCASRAATSSTRRRASSHPQTNLLGGFNGSVTVWLDASATNTPTRFYRAVAR